MHYAADFNMFQINFYGIFEVKQIFNDFEYGATLSLNACVYKRYAFNTDDNYC